ncbi:hypothetical protein J6TS1_25320 [Siminovitchia terrae]|uniref:Uncharacterized protein n=1 Tax=Siminovitchia terrae TaxID=1914933 RepID=A0ABQ4KXA2_SIMTE|nr:hypothetical protein [Siminovitchia terrae]GIN96662.1 hypothetical protein J6TS1_25320 [Siminovitchia terrae]
MGMTGLLVLVGVAGILIWGIKGMQRNVLKNKHYVKLLLIGYGLVLIAAVFIFEALPISEKEPDFNQLTDEQLDEEMNQFIETLLDGRTNEVDTRYVLNEWQWKYSGKEIRIEDQDWFDGSVIVERKPENDGMIEGTYYSKSIAGGIDITNEYRPLNVTLEKDTMHVKGKWGEKDLKFTIYEKEFVITQFTGGGKGAMDYGGFMEIDYLYLKIPKDLKLKPTNEDLYIHYVGEDE